MLAQLACAGSDAEQSLNGMPARPRIFWRVLLLAPGVCPLFLRSITGPLFLLLAGGESLVYRGLSYYTGDMGVRARPQIVRRVCKFGEGSRHGELNGEWGPVAERPLTETLHSTPMRCASPRCMREIRLRKPSQQRTREKRFYAHLRT